MFSSSIALGKVGKVISNPCLFYESEITSELWVNYNLNLIYICAQPGTKGLNLNENLHSFTEDSHLSFNSDKKIHPF